MKCQFAAAILAVMMCASSAWAQSDSPTKHSGSPGINLERAIAELGSPDYRTRVAASERLAKFGKRAKPQLTQLAKHDNAEVRSRAGELLARFEPVKKTATLLPDGSMIIGGEIVVDFDGPAVMVEVVDFDVDGDIEIIELVEEEIIDVVEVEVAPAAMRFVAPVGESTTDAAVADALKWLRKHETATPAKK